MNAWRARLCSVASLRPISLSHLRPSRLSTSRQTARPPVRHGRRPAHTVFAERRVYRAFRLADSPHRGKPISDITLRFDGILMVAALLLGALIYLSVAIVALLVGFVRRPEPTRAWRVARAAVGLSVATLFALLVTFSVWASSGASHTGTDWFDLMAVPWAFVFLAGCWGLTRV